MERIKAVLFAVFAVVLGFVAEAQAQGITLPTSVDVSDVETLTGTVLVGLFTIWAVRKVIKLANRS